jgi:hypothetical protein
VLLLLFLLLPPRRRAFSGVAARQDAATRSGQRRLAASVARLDTADKKNALIKTEFYRL